MPRSALSHNSSLEKRLAAVVLGNMSQTSFMSGLSGADHLGSGPGTVSPPMSRAHSSNLYSLHSLHSRMSASTMRGTQIRRSSAQLADVLPGARQGVGG